MPSCRKGNPAEQQNGLPCGGQRISSMTIRRWSLPIRWRCRSCRRQRAPNCVSAKRWSGCSRLRGACGRSWLARSRFAEDALERAFATGVRQYVVLGAGLDTYAARSPHEDLRVFEVDHPATQAWKRHRLQESGIHLADTVTFVPVDFEHERLMDRLVASGFDANAPAFGSWLGVLPYLTREAAEGTLRALGRLPQRSGVAFDYAVERASLSSQQQAAFDWLADRVARAGEPFRLAFMPADLRELLAECGFARVEDLDGEAIHARYFAERSDGLMVRGGLGRLACAWRE
jgi:methyltransferase (TIGR00027 family)